LEAQTKKRFENRKKTPTKKPSAGHETQTEGNKTGVIEIKTQTSKKKTFGGKNFSKGLAALISF